MFERAPIPLPPSSSTQFIWNVAIQNKMNIKSPPLRLIWGPFWNWNIAKNGWFVLLFLFVEAILQMNCDHSPFPSTAAMKKKVIWNFSNALFSTSRRRRKALSFSSPIYFMSQSPFFIFWIRFQRTSAEN